MKRYFSAAFAAAALFALSGCTDTPDSSVTEVSTDDTSAGMTSNYTSQSLQSEIVSTSAVTEIVSSAATSVSYSGTTFNTAVTLETVTASDDQTKPSGQKSSQKATSTKAVSASSNADTTSATVPTTTTSAEVTQTQEATTRPSPLREDIIAAYREAVSDTIDTLLSRDPEAVTVSYTLFDMDGNGIPELIIKSGTNDDDLLDAYYTYDDFGLKTISDGGSGAHSGFAWDPEAKKYVLAYAWMGEGLLSWKSFDGSDIIELKSSALEYNSEDTFEMQMEKNGVEQLPFAKYTSSTEETTWIYKVVGGRLENDQILSGIDFSFLDEYDF